MNMSKKKNTDEEKKNVLALNFFFRSLTSSFRSTFHVPIVNLYRRGAGDDSECADLLMRKIAITEQKKKKRIVFFVCSKEMNCLQNVNIPFIDSMNINCVNMRMAQHKASIVTVAVYDPKTKGGVLCVRVCIFGSRNANCTRRAQPNGMEQFKWMKKRMFAVLLCALTSGSAPFCQYYHLVLDSKTGTRAPSSEMRCLMEIMDNGETKKENRQNGHKMKGNYETTAANPSLFVNTARWCVHLSSRKDERRKRMMVLQQKKNQWKNFILFTL